MKCDPEDVRLGGWIVATYKALGCYDLEDPVFDAYEATILAGKAAELLSSIRALGKIDGPQFEIRRQLARLKPKQGASVMEDLERLGAVEVDWEKDEDQKHVKAVASLAKDKADVFALTAQLFRAFSPSWKSRASLEALEATVRIPLRESEVLSLLSQKGLPDDAAERAIDDVVRFGLLARTQEKEGGDALIYNPHVFKSNVQDAYRALQSLHGKDREAALEILNHVQKKPGVPFPPGTNKSIVSLLTKAGIIDISGIQVKGGATEKEFPTAPNIWGVLSLQGENSGLSTDLIDDSKLLLNSLRYGEFYSGSSRGRIKDPAVLVNALIQRGAVGPATAIGEDYPLPLARGIVSITESRMYPGRFFMELRKHDVAEAVRDVLAQNVILPAGDVPPPDTLETSGQFRSPEQIRIKRGVPKELAVVRDALAFDLRTFRKRK